MLKDNSWQLHMQGPGWLAQATPFARDVLPRPSGVLMPTAVGYDVPSDPYCLHYISALVPLSSALEGT